MDFELSEEQQGLRDVSRSLLRDHSSAQHVRSAVGGEDTDDKLWERGAELGWTALAIPEPYGGLGQGLAELTIVAEELGRAAARGPFLPTALGGFAVAWYGSTPLRADVLPALAEGSARAAWAVASAGGWTLPALRVTATPDGDAVMLNGRKTAVQDAGSANWLLVTATADGQPCLIVVERGAPGLRVRRQQALDLTRNLYEVVFDNVRVPASRRLSAGAAAVQGLMDAAATLTAADALGAGTRLLEMTVEHAKTRVQFGQPIGGFQAVKHKCADMRMLVQGTRAAVYYAAMALDAAAGAAGTERGAAAEPAFEVTAADASEAASTAKAFASDAMSRLAGEALQVHGGIGFTWEHDLHLFLRRIKTDEQLYGDSAVHRERLCEFLVARNAAGQASPATR